ncbi:MAG: hexokinase [Spirochaetales bacterium]|jgi:hexokinase|nr:hexokinase [Spirochaetales bacterium]
MVSGIERADGFLKELGISADSFSTQHYCELFLDEMQKGLEGKKSSLQMIPTYISTDKELLYDSPVIVIDAGGTNLRTAVVQFGKSGDARISQFSKQDMPGVKKEVTARQFFSSIADAVEPVFNASDKMGFCFSYAADITEDRDGRLIVFSKEIKAPEVIGKLVGKELLQELAQRGFYHQKRLTLLNDTVATLLAGKVNQSGKQYSGYVGFILGTGTNTSYVEQAGSITKLVNPSSDRHQIINIESGNFAVPASLTDQEFYETTKVPSLYHFEKLISGAYIGQYGLFIIKKATAEKMLSPAFGDAFRKFSGAFDTITMDTFLHQPHEMEHLIASCCSTDDDALFVYRLLDGVIERAAKLTAVNLSATVLKSGEGSDPRRPVCINADGTTYYKTHNLKRYTEWYLHEFLGKELRKYYEFVEIDNSPILGAAVAGLIG